MTSSFTWKISMITGFLNRKCRLANCCVWFVEDYCPRDCFIFRTWVPAFRWYPGPRLNIKTASPGYGDSFVNDKTVTRPSYLWHGDSHSGKMKYLYWDGPKDSKWCLWVTMSDIRINLTTNTMHINTSHSCYNVILVFPILNDLQNYVFSPLYFNDFGNG